MPRPRRPPPPPEEPSTQLVEVPQAQLPPPPPTVEVDDRRLLYSMFELKLKRLRSEMNDLEEELKKHHEGEDVKPQVVNEHEVPPLPNPFKRVGDVTARRYNMFPVGTIICNPDYQFVVGNTDKETMANKKKAMESVKVYLTS